MNATRRLAALATLALAGCAFEPAASEPFTPPPEYRVIWQAVEDCTGQRGEFTELRFFVVEGHCFDTPKGCAAGYTDGKTITLASEYAGHPMVVKHEMIHTLTGDGHPRVPFEDPCKATWDSWEGAVGPIPLLQRPAI